MTEQMLPSKDDLCLQVLILDPSLWQIHNCKLSVVSAVFDAPLPLLVQYDSLDDVQKSTHPLSFDLLKQMDTPMTAKDAAAAIGVNESAIKKAWQIKYIGAMVLFCEPLMIALRVQFSNTSKTAQTVYVKDESQAWQIEQDKYRFFGVVDVLYKGNKSLVSMADEMLAIGAKPTYQPLPPKHSLALVDLLNEHKEAFLLIKDTIKNHLPTIATQ